MKEDFAHFPLAAIVVPIVHHSQQTPVAIALQGLRRCPCYRVETEAVIAVELPIAEPKLHHWWYCALQI